MAMDYFKERYAGLPVVFDMSLIYIVVAFLTVLANNLLVETFSLNARINFGESQSLLTFFPNAHLDVNDLLLFGLTLQDDTYAAFYGLSKISVSRRNVF